MEKALLPLHTAQRDVYTDQLINAGSPHYNIGGYIRLKGNLDKEKFHATINSIPRVFDVFKMRFYFDDNEPKCYTDELFESIRLEEIDFTSAGEAKQQALVWMKGRFNKAFPIEADELLFEHYLLKVAPDEYYFYGRYHHLLTDGYGFILLVQYIAKKYRSLAGGEDLQFIYPSYLEETAEAGRYFSSPGYGEDEQYWKNKIDEKPADILLPKYQQDDSTGGTSSVYTLDIDIDTKKIFDKLQLDTTSGLHHLTIAALIVYFGKSTGHKEFVFGIPVHKRSSKKLRNIIGMFSGVLPFKGTYNAEQKLIDLVKEIVQLQKADYRHQHFPIGDLSRLLKVKSGEGYLQQITINYEPFDFKIDFGNDIETEVVRLTSDHERNPLQLSWRSYGEDQPLRLFINYSNKFFNHQEMQLLTERLLFILNQFSNGLENTIGSIEILPGRERAMLARFNETATPFPRMKTLVDLFEEQVKETPGNIALVFGQEEITYQQLNDRSNKLAHFLRSKNVVAEQLVPICMERSAEMIIAILGILKAGAAYVPIDPQYPFERIQFMLQDTAATICIASDKTRPMLQDVPSLEIICAADHGSLINDQPVSDLNLDIRTNGLAYIIYTSGSTGKPKGVMIEHSTVVNLIHTQSIYFNITPKERILQFSNYCFDASVEQIFLALTNGARLILFKEGLQLDVDRFRQLLIDQQVTHLHATPSFFENLLLQDNGSLKRVIAGGDLCKLDLAERWKNKVWFYNEYGPTETTVTAIEYKVEAGDCGTTSLPIGKPLSNIKVYIVDKEQQICPIGVPGELYIGGDCVARGYLNRAELSNEKFIPDPFDNTGKVYKTGDIGCWLPDGNIIYQGRIDEQVKIRGYRIELGEIENVLQEHEAIRQAVVLARKDSNDNNRLVAYIVPECDFDKAAIQQYLRTKLPDYMIPALWMQIDSIPLTSNGKVDRKNLPDPAASELIGNEYVAPGNELEAHLAHIWEEILKVEKAGVNDNFFELGGHSLNAIQLSTRLHKRLDIKVDIATIFSHPTIHQLALILAQQTRSKFVSINRLPVQEYYPLSHAQERFWVLSHFKDGSAAYNIASAFSIQGNLKLPAFKKAFEAVIERHEILRTIFIEVEGKAQQKVLDPKEVGFSLSEIDLRDISNKEAHIKKWVEEDAKRVFDLSKGPLLRATLFCHDAGNYTLAFNIHHIISDGWSKTILIKEFLGFYKAFALNEPLQLGALPIQYKDYAAWHTASFASQGKYWKDLYKNNIPVLAFPLDYERPKVLTFFGAMTQTSLAPGLTAGLRKVALENNISMNNLFLSLYAFIVARYSSQQEVLIGSLTSGRSHIDLENLVGVFINFLPIKFSVDKKQSLAGYLAVSNKALSQAYSNQDYPFDLVVEECIKHRDISRNPFFDTMLNFHLESDLQGSDFGEDQLKDTGIQIKQQLGLQDELFQSVLDFKLDIEPAGDGLELFLSYNSKLFREETMDIFLAEFTGLLQAVADDPTKMISAYGEWKHQKETPKSASESTEEIAQLPVNICASFVMEPIQEYIEYWSNEVELNIKPAFAPYNQVFQQLLDPGSLLNTSSGINVLFIRLEDWLREQHALTASDQLDFLDKTFGEFTNAIGQVSRQNFAPFLAGIVPVINESNFNSDVVSRISYLNDQLELIVKKQPTFHLLDLEKIAGLYDVDERFDPKSDELGHMPFTQEYYAAIGTYLARKVNAFKGPNYKVLALDCDNTLWKGICGEVGAREVIIDENFTALQEFFIEKYNEGFLLVLCSKNNEPDVWEVFDSHPGMKLKREHIAAHRINWEAKSTNLQSLAKDLNLGLNSFIFLDDNEFEVEQITGTLPEVLAIALPEDADSFESFLRHIWAFDYFRITEEDTKRNQMYKVEKQRREEEVRYGSVSDFLQSLDIQVNISPITEVNMERAVQLTLRTNQFNLNGIRKTAEEISKELQLSNSINWVIDVQDRFGEYGIVGVVLAKQIEDTLQVETFLLSCRVLGRNVEDQVLAELESYCLNHGLGSLTVQYIPTTKNKPFQEFLARTQWKNDPGTNNYFRPQENIEQTTA